MWASVSRHVSVYSHPSPTPDCPKYSFHLPAEGIGLCWVGLGACFFTENMVTHLGTNQARHSDFDQLFRRHLVNTAIFIRSSSKRKQFKSDTNAFVNENHALTDSDWQSKIRKQKCNTDAMPTKIMGQFSQNCYAREILRVVKKLCSVCINHASAAPASVRTLHQPYWLHRR